MLECKVYYNYSHGYINRRIQPVILEETINAACYHLLDFCKI